MSIDESDKKAIKIQLTCIYNQYGIQYRSSKMTLSLHGFFVFLKLKSERFFYTLSVMVQTEY